MCHIKSGEIFSYLVPSNRKEIGADKGTRSKERLSKANESNVFNLASGLKDTQAIFIRFYTIQLINKLTNDKWKDTEYPIYWAYNIYYT